MITHRILPRGGGIKLIFWYIGAIQENAPLLKGEVDLSAKLFGFEEALATLTFASDRDIVRNAIEIFEETAADAQHLS